MLLRLTDDMIQQLDIRALRCRRSGEPLVVDPDVIMALIDSERDARIRADLLTASFRSLLERTAPRDSA